jgi:amidase
MKLGEYVKYDAIGLAELVEKGEITPDELATLAQEAAKKVNDKLNAIVSIFDEPYQEEAIEGAKFRGVPTFMKDLGASVIGITQESGSRLTAGLVSPLTTNFAQNVLNSGFQLIGRSACPEFGLTLTTESVSHGITRNPWNTDHIAGGSSGGSAALVASGVVPLAHSNDGGGSTRIPASCCGNLGLKTSRGRVSLGPIMNDVSSPLIAEGCNSRTVRDTAAFLDAVSKPAAGEGVMNSFIQESFLAGLEKAPETYRIAVSFDDWGSGPLESGIRDELERIAQSLREKGHKVEEATPTAVQADYFDAFKVLWYSLAHFVVHSVAPMTNRTPDSSTLESITLKMVREGEKVTGFDVNQTMALSNQMSREFGEFFHNWDLLLTPTFIKGTPKVGGSITLNSDVSLEQWFDEASSLIPGTPIANMTGLPAISVPCAIGPGGLPLGMHFFAAMGNERVLIDIARQLEESEPWINRTPSVYAV